MKNLKILMNLKNIFIIFLISLCFIGCTQSVPEVRQSFATVIFEYSEYDVYPDSRMCVFAQSESNVNRYESIKLVSENPSLTWETSDLAKLVVSKKQYIGYTNFSLPKSICFPTGTYKTVYVNADSEQTETTFFLDYDSTFYETKAESIEELMRAKKGKRKVAVFDSSDVLVYFGDYTFQNKDDLKKKVKDAKYYRFVWSVPDNSIMCLLPAEKI